MAIGLDGPTCCDEEGWLCSEEMSKVLPGFQQTTYRGSSTLKSQCCLPLQCVNPTNLFGEQLDQEE